MSHTGGRVTCLRQVGGIHNVSYRWEEDIMSQTGGRVTCLIQVGG